jgi:hypothetical protein
MVVTAPVAYAKTESQIQYECEHGGSGMYNTFVAPDGKPYSTCCYHDNIDNQNVCDYVNGQFQSTQPARAETPPPSWQPASPPGVMHPVNPPVMEQP